MKNYKYNELSQVKQILENGFGTKNINGELKLLAKYYRDLGMKPKEREKALYDFCKKHLVGFNKVLYFSKINSALNYAKRKDTVMIEIEKMEVLKGELDFIDKLEIDIDYKKILFTLLVITKLNRQVYYLKHGKTNDKFYFGGTEKAYRELLNFSKVNLNTRRKQGKTIHNVISKLAECGLVKIKNNGHIELLFMYNLPAHDECVMEIKYYSEIGGYYDLYLGNSKIIQCKICGIPLVKKSNKTKYCKDCKIEKQKEWQRESMRKKRCEVIENS